MGIAKPNRRRPNHNQPSCAAHALLTVVNTFLLSLKNSYAKIFYSKRRFVDNSLHKGGAKIGSKSASFNGIFEKAVSSKDSALIMCTNLNEDVVGSGFAGAVFHFEDPPPFSVTTRLNRRPPASELEVDSVALTTIAERLAFRVCRAQRAHPTTWNMATTPQHFYGISHIFLHKLSPV